MILAVFGCTREEMDLPHAAPAPAKGRYADGFAPVARRFATQLASSERGAALCVHHRGEVVVDLWGGVADRASGRPWAADTRVVVFSVTKGFAAMAMNLLVDRGQLDLDAPVAAYWPEIGQRGKEGITVRCLLNHRSGLLTLDEPVTMEDCVRPDRAEVLRGALERQRPLWSPGERQGYHAITYGMYVRELFERVAGEPLGTFLRRELFDPLGSDVYVGTPRDVQAGCATLEAPPNPRRIGGMIGSGLVVPEAPESRILRSVLSRTSLPRRAFSVPKGAGVLAYDEPDVRAATLAWASATGSARGLSRAYLPWAQGGEHAGRRYVRASSIEPILRRQSWAERDEVLQKPVGWSEGFLKEERHLFSPHAESFGHAGMGGALGWCDPVDQLTFGYVLNRMDWRIRSPRAVALCRSLYECPALCPAAR